MREYPSVLPSVLVSKHVYQEAIDHLEGRVAVDYNDSDESLSGERLRDRLGGKQGVICQLTDRIDAPLLDAVPNVRVVSNIAVGFDNIDVPAASERHQLTLFQCPGAALDHAQPLIV